MTRAPLQDQVFNRARELLDPKYPDWDICVDLFKPREALGSEFKIQEIGIEKAAQMIVDDSLYWAEYFHGVGRED